VPITVVPKRGGTGPRPLSEFVGRSAPDTLDVSPVAVEDVSAPVPAANDDGPGLGSALLAGGALAAGALALRNPQMAKSAASKIGGWLNEARYGSMLSGMAIPKSAMGNIGAAVVTSAERGSTRPLREFLSTQTVRDWVDNVWNAKALGQAAGGQMQSGVTQGSSWLNLPGRIIGAGDVATRNALVRAGLTEKEAAIQLLQRPVTDKTLKKAFDNPVARYLFPFRTVPLNTFREGLLRMDPTAANPHRLVSLGAMGAGAVTGAVTDDPRTVAMTSPIAGTYAMPYVVGGMIGKYLTGDGEVGPAKQVVAGMSPYSDYAIGTLLDPLRPYTKPAALGALDYLFQDPPQR